MKLLYYSLALYLSLTPGPACAASSKDSKKEPDKACTITSPYSGSFFDLTSLQLFDPKENPKKLKHPREHSWNATGWDMGYNFTINICQPVIEKVEDVVGIEKSMWKNVSAYYKQDGKTYSLGQQNDELVMRGRKLVLNYTDGSPCDTAGKSTHSVVDLKARALVDEDKDDKKKGDGKKKDDDGDDKDSKKKPSSGSTRRKSTVISMLCEKDPTAPQFAISFVGSPDECSYFFEARSHAACATANTSSGGSLNPGGVFGVIVLIAVLVYFVGGCVYNRAVLNQRGWQQVPNYHLWASIWGFFRDLFIILTSSCARFMPSRRGYSRVNGGFGGAGSGRRARGDSSDAENRLIDELNEEWED
ncbi:mannose 6-phosphate receptor [Lecanosticta acicola]|uniref:Mannose 6-phosphate receptor n=1 Tax=Lecanosticta acicola TaxID=111012 RepID=A0AAI8Z1B6_9PEZI|nr:mannose 6-phosphate receptor [Lecanosticta acicola]